MDWDEFLQNVDPRWHTEFRKFVSTGRASEEFLDYFDATPACQEAAGEVLAKIFEPFAKTLQEEDALTAQRRAAQTGS